MEELFRFVSVRPPEAVDEEEASPDVIRLDTGSDFQERLRRSENQAERTRVARDFEGDERFVADAGELPLAPRLRAVQARYEDADPGGLQASDVVAGVAADLDLGDQNPRPKLRKLVGSNEWASTGERLRDTITAIRDAPQLHRYDAATLARLLRAMHLAESAAATDDDDEVDPGRLMRATLVHRGVRPEEPATDLEPAEPDEDETPDRLAEVTRAIDQVMEMPRAVLQIDEDHEERPDDAPRAATQVGKVLVNHVSRPRLGERALQSLPAATRSAIESLPIDPAKDGVEQIVAGLQNLQRDLASSQLPVPRKATFGGTTLSTAMLDSLKQLQFFESALDNIKLEFLPKLAFKGYAQPAGVGDLLLVRQQLKRYEGGDIAHVENVLHGETKEREHRRRRTTEEVFVTEVERETSEEHETQTTTRFELRTEVQQEVSTSLEAEAGVKVTANYGMVKVEAEGNVAYKNARKEARQRAASMSREVVDRAATKYTERVREERTRRLVEEVEEINRHSLDATGTDGHVIGVYQWLNKIYEAQVYNYGLRVMYDFMVPEPAAYYIWQLSKQAANAEADLVPPPPFELQPQHLNDGNYDGYVSLYKATTVTPPPDAFTTVDIHKHAGPNPDPGPILDSDAATVPDGYEFVGWSGNWYYTFKKGDDHDFTISVTPMTGNPGTVPIRIGGHSLTGYTAYIHILCRRTVRAYREWQFKTWDTLRQAHQELVNEYEEKLAALAIQEGVEISGRNPVFNRKVERRELQKSAVHLITGVPPVWLNGISETAAGPQIKPSAATSQGAYVRFFEHAFEWEHMTYVLYPYFWARGAKWRQLMEIEDIDPDFQDFLTAGYARVVVPVRPGFEDAVEHYRQTGQIWSGGDLPTIADPDYLPIAEEVKARLQAPGDEEPVEDPWEVLVPTQLVRLRPDGSLPRWEKQEDGSWQEVDTSA